MAPSVFVCGIAPTGLTERDRRVIADAVADFEARPVDPEAAARAQEIAARRHAAAQRLGVKCPKGTCRECWQ